ncbi:MAG: hypothetical protein PHH13_05090 [Candidatus Peribacteraceae bacterium]|nr:hypothetical protein [Candidatus Peribacteraceae bacterium]
MLPTHKLLIALTPLLMVTALLGNVVASRLTAWDAGTDTETSRGAYGARCWVDNNCESGVCKLWTSSPNHRQCGCREDGQCPQGQLCSRYPGYNCFTPQCETDADCTGQESGYICRERVCVPCITPGLGVGFKCSVGKYCSVDGACIALKAADELCDKGTECLSGGCISFSNIPAPPGITPGNHMGICGCSAVASCPSGRVCFGDHCTTPRDDSADGAVPVTKKERIDVAMAAVQQAQQGVAAAQATFDDAQDDADAALSVVTEAKDAYAEAKEARTDAKQAYAIAKVTYKAADDGKKEGALEDVSAAKEAYLETSQDVIEAKATYAIARTAYATAKSAYAGAKRMAKTAAKELKAAGKALAKAQASK